MLYISDLISCCQKFTTILFADDTNLFLTSKDLNEESETINDELNNIKNWCNSNKLTLNIDKTNFIIIKNAQNKSVMYKEIKMHNTEIAETNEIRFLGVIIDKSLNWSAHIHNLRSNLHKSLGLIYQASTFLPNSYCYCYCFYITI